MGPQTAMAVPSPGCPKGPSPADRRTGSGQHGAAGVILFFALVYTKTTYRNNKIFHS